MENKVLKLGGEIYPRCICRNKTGELQPKTYIEIKIIPQL